MRTWPRWRWIEGEVATGDPHFALRWPSGRWPGYRETADVARVGRTLERPDAFVVEWLAAPALAPHHLLEARADALAEVRCYLVDRGGDDPWGHARDHCSSAANLHSCVRWLHVDPRDRSRLARPGVPPSRSIPVTCPRCSTPTRLADTRRFACPACAWHD